MLTLFVFSGVVSVMIIRHEWLIHRIRSCDACRIDHLDRGMSIRIPHTCSKSHALYRDRRGNVYEFGRFVRSEKKIA